MKKMIFFLLLSAGALGTQAQTSKKFYPVKVDKQKNLVIFVESNHVEVEGYDGNDVVLDTDNTLATVDKGDPNLKKISLNRPPDAVHYQLTNAQSNQTELRIEGTYTYIRIRVPMDIYWLSVQSRSLAPNATVVFNKYNRQFSLNAIARNVKIDHVKGPFDIHAQGAKIQLSNVQWEQGAKWDAQPMPPQLTSPYLITGDRDVEVSLPSTLKATINAKAINGKVYSALAIDDSKLNGGGVLINAVSGGGNIYFQKAN